MEKSIFICGFFYGGVKCQALPPHRRGGVHLGGKWDLSGATVTPHMFAPHLQNTPPLAQAARGILVQIYRVVEIDAGQDGKHVGLKASHTDFQPR